MRSEKKMLRGPATLPVVAVVLALLAPALAAQETIRQYQFQPGGAGYELNLVEVGGSDTLHKALEAIAYDGHIGLIGGLSGFAPSIPVGTMMQLGVVASGVYVGSRADFEAMNAFIEEHQIVPVVDRVFDFEDAPAAFDFMENGSYFGKIVITH
jgi:NADPH:quinone reductase-like Zn-dependent oxidoreductase